MTVFNNDHHNNIITRATQKKSGVPYYIKALETSAYNIDFLDTSIIHNNTPDNTTTVKTENEALTWKDWFKFLREHNSADIDNKSYNGNTIEDRIKNAAEYFGNNVFSLEVEKFALVRSFEKIANIQIDGQL